MKTKCFFARVYAGGRACRGMLGVMVLVGMMGMLWGCGLIEESESTSYHIPNWTSDGEIIALKRWMKHRKTLISNSEPVGYRETVVLMGPNGENERELFRVVLGSPKLLERSPQGNYIGVVDGRVLVLYDRHGNLLKEIIPDPEVTHIKFSPDETKIYGTQDFHNMVFYAVSDLVELDRNDFGGGGGFVNNDTVVYDDRIDREMAFYSLSEGKTLLGNTFPYTPQVYNFDTNTLYSLDAEYVHSYVLGADSYASRSVSWEPYDQNQFTGKHLSADGGRVVMGATGFESEGTGIYLLDTESDAGVVRLR